VFCPFSFLSLTKFNFFSLFFFFYSPFFFPPLFSIFLISSLLYLPSLQPRRVLWKSVIDSSWLRKTRMVEQNQTLTSHCPQWRSEKVRILLVWLVCDKCCRIYDFWILSIWVLKFQFLIFLSIVLLQSIICYLSCYFYNYSNVSYLFYFLNYHCSPYYGKLSPTFLTTQKSLFLLTLSTISFFLFL
jgi:hypothetical protein